MAINKFADLDEGEMKNLMRPKAKNSHKEAIVPAAKTHVRSTTVLPDYVNWIEQGGAKAKQTSAVIVCLHAHAIIKR